MLEHTDVSNKEQWAEGWPAAQGTEVVHLVLEVCSAGQDGGVAFGALSEQTPGDQLPPVRARTSLHFPAAHPFPESLSRLSSASVSPQRDWSQIEQAESLSFWSPHTWSQVSREPLLQLSPTPSEPCLQVNPTSPQLNLSPRCTWQPGEPCFRKL